MASHHVTRGGKAPPLFSREQKRGITAGLILLGLVLLFRRVLGALLIQLFAAYVLMALALPLCRVLETKLSPSLAATLSFLALSLTGAALLLLLVPPLFRQLRQLSESLPAVLSWAEGQLGRLQQALTARGVDLALLREELFTHLGQHAGSLVSRTAKQAAAMASAAGKLFLSPLMAFYLLRDRKRISTLLTLVIPIRCRARAVRAGREMRREAAAFLRGQLLVSAAVGGLTALGLLLTGSPAWLLLGLLMGVMELIPYLGPVIAGIPAVLLALERGPAPALWTLAVLVLVQQAEGTVLSPRLLSGVTGLHPLAVLLAISAGGLLAGPVGMLAALPAVVALRGALRGLRTPSPGKIT